MTRLRIDDPAIDLEALEARVLESIERKRGRRFAEEDLERLRATRLRPRLRREDLPRGVVAEMAAARPRAPEPTPPPGPEAASLSQVAIPPESWVVPAEVPVPPPPPEVDLGHGWRAALKRRLRPRLARIYRWSFEIGPWLDPILEPLLVRLRQMREELVERDEQLARQAERAFDLLKDNLDRRVDRTGDWAGSHMSTLQGGLERRQERELHLLHNLVFELTNARLDLINMQDRLNEAAQRVAALEERQRTLEKLLLESPEGREAGSPRGSACSRQEAPLE